MNIEKFENFVQKNGDLFDYGCVLVYPSIPNWNNITSIIDKEDLYKPNDPIYGYETSPHISILYGLFSNVKDQDVINVFKDISINDIEINGIGVFENKEYDVVKLNIKSNTLHLLNKELLKLPHTSDYYQNYHPHMTLAFVLKGRGKKYVDDNYQHNFNKINKVVYSKTNNEKIEIPLN